MLTAGYMAVALRVCKAAERQHVAIYPPATVGFILYLPAAYLVPVYDWTGRVLSNRTPD